MALFSIKLPINISNVLTFLLELLFAELIFPLLIRHADYVNTRIRLHRQGVVIPGNSQFRALSGGVDRRPTTVLLYIISILIALALIFSLEPTKIPVTTEERAMLYRQKTNLSHTGTRELICAALQCKKLESNSTNIYMPFVSYEGYLHRSKNTRNDRRCGGRLVSCLGKGIGNTISKRKEEGSEVTLRALCCEHCNSTTSKLSEEFSYIDDSTGKLVTVRICSNDSNLPVMQKAFDIMRELNDSKVPLFNRLHDEIIPSLIWEETNPEENRKYVYHVVDGTEVRESALVLLFLFVLVLLHFGVYFANRLIGYRYDYHGTSDSDVRALLEAALSDENDLECDPDAEYSQIYFCGLYGFIQCTLRTERKRNKVYLEMKIIPEDLSTNCKPCPICCSSNSYQ